MGVVYLLCIVEGVVHFCRTTTSGHYAAKGRDGLCVACVPLVHCLFAVLYHLAEVGPLAGSPQEVCFSISKCLNVPS